MSPILYFRKPVSVSSLNGISPPRSGEDLYLDWLSRIAVPEYESKHYETSRFSRAGETERKDFQMAIAMLEGDDAASVEELTHRSLVDIVGLRKSRSLNVLPEDIVGWKHALVTG